NYTLCFDPHARDELGSRRAKDVMAAIYSQGINPWTQARETTRATQKEAAEKGVEKVAKRPVKPQSEAWQRNYRALAIKLESRGLLREGQCFQWGVPEGVTSSRKLKSRASSADRCHNIPPFRSQYCAYQETPPPQACNSFRISERCQLSSR